MKAQNQGIKSLWDNKLHRTASINEYSTRYSEAIDQQNTTTPDEWRLQSKNNKQGSAGLMIDEEAILSGGYGGIPYDHYGNSYKRKERPGPEAAEMMTDEERYANAQAKKAYNHAMLMGVAREQARKLLPLSTYTEAYWKVDLHNLLHFLRLRLDSHAQLEIREFAQAIATIVQDWVPWTWEAFVDYRLESVNFSRQEMGILKELLEEQIDYLGSEPEFRQKTLGSTGLTKRERLEFWKKITSGS